MRDMILQTAEKILDYGKNRQYHGWVDIPGTNCALRFYKSIEGEVHHAVSFFDVEVQFFNDPKISIKSSQLDKIETICKNASELMDKIAKDTSKQYLRDKKIRIEERKRSLLDELRKLQEEEEL